MCKNASMVYSERDILESSIRTKLVPAKGSLESIYFYQKGIRKGKRITVGKFKQNRFITPDMAEALSQLDITVKNHDGTLYIIDLFRSYDAQHEAHQAYLNGEKPFVARPGESFHNAGRAVDIDVKNLNFKNVKRKEHLKYFWYLAKDLGFRPIIGSPNVNISESWHFDFPGNDWIEAYERVNYSQVARAAVADVGMFPEPSDHYESRLVRFVQSQMIRIGKYEIGKIDGFYGAKTDSCLRSMGIKIRYKDRDHTINSLVNACRILKNI